MKRKLVNFNSALRHELAVVEFNIPRAGLWNSYHNIKNSCSKKREGTTLSFLLFCQFMNQSLNKSSEMNSPGSARLLPCQSFWFCRFTRTAGLSVKWEYKHKTFSSINFTPLCEKTSWEGYVLFHHLYFGNSLDSCYCFLTRLLQSSHFR